MSYDQMNFSDALLHLKAERKVCRAGWNGRGMHLIIALPENDLFLPYIQIRTVQGQLVPWSASQTDLLAEDWQLLD